MKLLVPLMMPASHSMRFPASPSRTALMMGIPPATAASNATITPAAVRGLEDRVAVHRDKRLVRGDHVLAAIDGFEDELAGGVGAADELDDHVDVRVPDDPARIGGERDAVGGADTRPVERPDRGPRDHDAATGPPGDLLAVAPQHVDGAAADRSEAEHSDPNRGHARYLRCSSRRRPRGLRPFAGGGAGSGHGGAL